MTYLMEGGFRPTGSTPKILTSKLLLDFLFSSPTRGVSR